MSLTLVDIATLVGILAVLNVPVTLVIRASMSSSFMPRESLTLHLDRISSTLEDLKRDVSRLQSPPVIDRLQVIVPRLEDQADRVVALEKSLEKLHVLLDQLPGKMAPGA